MSLKKQLEKLEGNFHPRSRNRPSRIKYRRLIKKHRNKWIRRSRLPNVHKVFKGWEY